MVATISPGGMQPHDRLVPPSIFAQVLRKPCQGAFGQSLELLYHLLTFVHGVKTLHPKHNLHLHFQGQHATKRFLFLGSTNPRQSMMTTSNMEWDFSALVYLYYLFLKPITHSRQDLGSHPKKCTHGGYPLESPLVVKLPHVMSLHQSAPLIQSLNPVARSV